MVNSNPETVSTDFDASARLYFDPLDEESIAAVLGITSGTVGATLSAAHAALRNSLEEAHR